MDKAMDIENLKPVLKKVLQSFHLTTEDIKAERSRIAIYAHGQFTCGNCVHQTTGEPYTWASAFSWLTFDLKELIVYKKWKMKCRHCEDEFKPYFTPDQLENMFRKAVEIYKGKDSKPTDIGYGARRMFRQPHLPRLCEKCGWGATCCWHGFRSTPI